MRKQSYFSLTCGYIARGRFEFHYDLRYWALPVAFDLRGNYIKFFQILCFEFTISKV